MKKITGVLIVVMLAIGLSACGEEEKIATKSESDNSQFYELDEILESVEPGDSLMNINDYNGFSIGVYTLEGAIAKFGTPTHATGANEGDSQMELAFDTNESGNSIGLIFENKKTGFGNWVLLEKYVVKTEGISFPTYSKK